MELGVRGVDGDVDGADAQINDALSLPLRQIGEGDIVALQKAQPGIVVLKIEGLAHTGGHLVHKAEHTVVGAAAHFVHQIGVEIQPKIQALFLFDLYIPHGTVGLQQLQPALGIIAVEAVVQHVHDLVAVDGQQLLAGPDPRPLGRAAVIHRGDNSTHGFIPSYFTLASSLL